MFDSLQSRESVPKKEFFFSTRHFNFWALGAYCPGSVWLAVYSTGYKHNCIILNTWRDQYIYPFTCVIFILDGGFSEVEVEVNKWKPFSSRHLLPAFFLPPLFWLFFFHPLFLARKTFTSFPHPCFSSTMAEISISENSFFLIKNTSKSIAYYILLMEISSFLMSSAGRGQKYQQLKILHIGHGHGYKKWS